MNVRALLLGAVAMLVARIVLAEVVVAPAVVAQYLTAWAAAIGMAVAAAVTRRERALHALAAVGVYAIGWYLWRALS